MVSIDDLIAKDSAQHLENLLEKLEASYPNLKFQTHSISGGVDDAVRHFLRSNQVDMVVMGTTGASGLKGKLFGSNASSLIQNIKTPLLVVPHNAKIKDPTRIGISTDLKIAMTDEIYNPIRKIALAFGSKINFFNVSDVYKEDQLISMEESFGMDIDFIYGHDIEESIKEYLDEVHIDILVFVAEKHSIFHKIFKPSISKTMARELEIPMLILAQ
jgi:nucleotide-binding universal stress UspA family protein